MTTLSNRRMMVAALALVVAMAGVGQAVPVTLVTSMPYGQSWDNGIYWDDGLPAQAGNDYHVGDSTGKGLRTPNNVSNPVFPGDSLTVHSTGTMALKHNGTVTIDNLILDGGTVSCAVGNRTMTVGGNLFVQAPSTFSMGGTNRRTIQLTSTVTGAADLTLTGSGSPAEFRLNADTSGYTGQWIVNPALDRLDCDSGTMNVAGGFSLDQMRVGYNGGTGTVITDGGDVTLADISADLNVGRRDGSGGTTIGTLDLSASTNVTINADDIFLGVTNGSRAQGTLILGSNNTLTVTNEIRIGDSTNAGQSGAGQESALILGQTNVINANSLYIGRRKSRGEMTFAAPGGTLTLGSDSDRVEVIIGRNDHNTGAVARGLLDLTGGTGELYLSRLVVGHKYSGGAGGALGTFLGGTGGLVDIGTSRTGEITIGRNVGGDTRTEGLVDLSNVAQLNASVDVIQLGTANNQDQAVGTFILAQSNNIEANTIMLGDSPAAGQTSFTSTMTLGGANTIIADLWTVGGRKSKGLVDMVDGGVLNLGSSGDRGELRLGYNNFNTGTTAVGTFDVSNGTANVYASDIVLGHKSGGGSGSATGTYIVGDGMTDAAGSIHETGDGGTSSVIVVGNHAFNVGGIIDVDSFIIGNDGQDGTATFTGSVNIGAGTGDFLVARNLGNNSGTTSIGIADFSGASSTTFNVDLFHVGVKGDNSNGVARGQVTLAPDNTIVANEIKVGRSGNNGGSGNELHFGSGTNDVTTQTLIVGQYKGTGLVDVAAGGTVNLGNAGNRVEITVGLKDVWTGGSNSSTIDLSAGTANLFASNVNLGQESDSTGSGNPGGSLILGDGSLDVTGNVWEGSTTTGDGSSTLTVVGDQVFTIGGAVEVDNFRIGYNAENGSVTYAAGSTASIGSGSGNLDVGVRSSALSGNPTTVGVLDLSDAASVVIDVANVRIGNIIGSPSGEGKAQGTLILSQAGPNSITANSVIVGDSPGRGNTIMSSLQLGAAANTINTDALTLGGRKGQGSMTFSAPGGTLTLEGKTPGTPVDVNLGINVTGNTGTASIGMLDTRGGALDATIDALRLGGHNQGSGRGTGTLAFDAGTITANSVVMGIGNGNATGTIIQEGGTFTVNGSVTDGGGDANFLWTAGTFTVGTFDIGKALDNTAAGILAPGGAGAGTTQVVGDYVQGPGATYQVHLEDFGAYDYLEVLGVAELDGILEVIMDPSFQPPSCTSLVILEANEIVGEFAVVDFSQAQFANTAMDWEVLYIDGQETDQVVLHAVPEPATLSLLGLGALALLRRRRRQ